MFDLFLILLLFMFDYFFDYYYYYNSNSYSNYYYYYSYSYYKNILSNYIIIYYSLVEVVLRLVLWYDELLLLFILIIFK
jgi:hypothetical protein